MRYISTRSSMTQPSVDFVTAIHQGLASDGGLYVPASWPPLDIAGLESSDLHTLAYQILHPFVDGSSIVARLTQCCANTYNFPLPLKRLTDDRWVLELFHGPTLSFKDFGARFLAQCLACLDQPMTILVATSGDTGSAVASGFFGQPNIRVVILFPKGKISQRQQAQITCWGGNISAVAVEGDFDDCQRLVKQALMLPMDKTYLSTANSINVGRLLAQVVYYAFASFRWQQTHGSTMPVVIPTGNVGNVTACFYAKQLGFPIGDVHIAINANRSLYDHWLQGSHLPRPTIATLANAMDVSVPSNLERLTDLFVTPMAFHRAMTVTVVSDQQIQQAVTVAFREYGYLLCPHTATAYYVAKQLMGPCCVVATADPAKFESVIEPLLGLSVPIPERLAAMMAKSRQPQTITPTLSNLKPLLVAPSTS